MKVRIANNKIRYRLKEPEVELFKNTGIVTEKLVFGSNDSEKLQFSLQVSNAENIDVEFLNNHIVVNVPSRLAIEWTTTGRVGFEAEVFKTKDLKIILLVEKDFSCLDGREEDNEGTYPNPLALNNR